jgi:A/G-specific adenine glycosylase
MLQQTRVAAVLEHYRIFLERFPDVRALASAAESAVLAVWSGLGYYRRARMMHLCAKKIVSEHAGRFPESGAALRELPGIGRYTAAAIASIAFGENTAVVDGNVERVLGRISGKRFTPEENWEEAQRLLDPARPGDFNQAMMELGATTCLPREPVCLTCPVRKWCATRGELANDTKAARQQKREIWCALDRRDGHIRLVRRSKQEALMAGMWELPYWSSPDRSGRAHWRTFKHSITVTDYTVHVVRGTPPTPNGKWVSIARIPAIPITGLTRKILKADGII